MDKATMKVVYKEIDRYITHLVTMTMLVERRDAVSIHLQGLKQNLQYLEDNYNNSSKREL